MARFSNLIKGDFLLMTKGMKKYFKKKIFWFVITFIAAVLLNFILFVDAKHDLITPETQKKSILYEPTYSIGNTLTATIHQKIKKN